MVTWPMLFAHVIVWPCLAMLLFGHVIVWSYYANSIIYSSILPNSFPIYRHRIKPIPCEAGKLATAGLSTLCYYYRHFLLTSRGNFCNLSLRSRDPSTTRVSAPTFLSLLYHLSLRKVAIKIKVKSYLCLIKYRDIKAL